MLPETPGGEGTWDYRYDGARPVRIGNAAYEQKQHDLWGAVLDSL